VNGVEERNGRDPVFLIVSNTLPRGTGRERWARGSLRDTTYNEGCGIEKEAGIGVSILSWYRCKEGEEDRVESDKRQALKTASAER